MKPFSLKQNLQAGILGLGAAVILCACAAGSQTAAVAPQAGVTSAAQMRAFGHALTSIASADNGEKPLFFASNVGPNKIYIFGLPDMTLKDTVGGLHSPEGECADTHGDVYVANGAHYVYEYSRRGKRLNTYDDSYGYPWSCAVDPATGNLAVTNFDGKKDSAGEVLVYSSPSSPPTMLSNPSQKYYLYAGYGPNSSLWVDGKTSTGSFILSSCNLSSCSTIPITGGTIYYPGTVQWDSIRGNWVVFDDLCGEVSATCSYPVSEGGSLGQQTKYLTYHGGSVCMHEAAIGGKLNTYVVGSDRGACDGSFTPTFNRWAYPAGGQPTNYAIENNASGPQGAAISVNR